MATILFRPTLLLPFSCFFLISLLPSACSLKHSFYEKKGKSPIGPVGVPFGFLEGGHYELSVFDFELTSTDATADVDSVHAGFFLKRFENEASFSQHMELLRENATVCSFEYFLDGSDDDEAPPSDDWANEAVEFETADHGIFLSMEPHKTRWKPNTPKIEYTFKEGEAGLYFLIYQVCPSKAHIRSTFELDFHFLNYDSLGHVSYLSAGETHLPMIYFFFSMSYLICLIAWVINLRLISSGKPGLFDRKDDNGPQNSSGVRPVVYPIHHLMSVLVLVKYLSVFFESIRYHAIRVTGHAELWSVVYYAFYFLKGTFLFTVILLLGSGWSFVKPFLNDRERKVIFLILFLQVINNLAVVILSQETEGETSYERWTAVLHLVDLFCCCAVLIPIVWQVSTLEKSIGMDGDTTTEDQQEGEPDAQAEERALESGSKGQILNKLKLFRSFYLLVIAYIYATRILVYLFATMLDYRHIWLKAAAVEIVTLAFYVVVATMFRPMVDNPYLGVKQDDDGGEEEMMELAKR